MTEKSTIFQAVQIGIEALATPGTPVAANRKMLACSFVPGVRSESDVFRASGNKYASFSVLNKEWSEVKIEGRISYNEILYPLVSLLQQPTPVQQGATAAYLWTFDPSTSAADSSRTLTIENGDATTAWRVAGARVSGLELMFSRNEVSMTGSAVGEALEAGVSLTGSPTAVTPIPVFPSHLSLKTASTRAGLTGATALTRAFSASFAITDKANMAWPIGQDPISIEAAPNATAKVKLATDATGVAQITAMRNGTVGWWRISAVGPLIASTYYNTIEIDFPAQVTDVSDFGDEDGIHVVEPSLTLIHDATWGQAYQIRVTNTITAAAI